MWGSRERNGREEEPRIETPPEEAGGRSPAGARGRNGREELRIDCGRVLRV